MVVGVFAGERPTAGYAVHIERVVPEKDRVLVEAVEIKPAKDAFVPQVITRPYHFVAIERSDHTMAYASPSVERLLGYRPEELVGTDARARVHPDDLGTVIGRGGRTAKALRQVIGSIGGRGVRVDIMDSY